MGDGAEVGLVVGDVGAFGGSVAGGPLDSVTIAECPAQPIITRDQVEDRVNFDEMWSGRPSTVGARYFSSRGCVVQNPSA